MNRFCRFALLAAILLAGACQGHAPAMASPPSAAGQRLTVIAFNAQFLPALGAMANKRPNAPYRARALVDRLDSYDLVALCEVFDDIARKTILDGFRTRRDSGFHFATPRPEDRSPFGIDSGLVVISRTPLEAHTLRYGNDSSPLELGLKADGFAAKGALHVRTRAQADSRHELDLIVTHLESKDNRARAKQYEMLADFAATHGSPDRPLVICGDLNTRGDPKDRDDPDSAYQVMMECLQKARPGLIDLIPEPPTGTNAPETPSGGRRIDYILLGNPAHGPRLHPVRVHIDHLDDPKVGTLSDHAAVCAEFEWTSDKPSTAHGREP